jgi:hypothetical protein
MVTAALSVRRADLNEYESRISSGSSTATTSVKLDDDPLSTRRTRNGLVLDSGLTRGSIW